MFLSLILAGTGAIGFATRLAAQGPPSMGAPVGPGQLGGGPPPGPGGPAGGPGGGAPAAPKRNNLSFSNADGKWAWLSQEGEDVILFTAPAGSPGKEAARGKGWTSVALEGGAAWIAAPKGNAGALLRIAEGAQPEEVVSCLGKPSGLQVKDGRVFWCERKMAPPKAPSFIPTLADQVLVRVREKDGKVRDLGGWPAGTETKSYNQYPTVIAVSDNSLFFRVPRLFSTDFVEIPLSGGDPKRVATEAEFQQGVVHQGEFYWTARSREAMPELGMRRVCRRQGGEAETIGEWLPMGGSLVSMPDGLYYVAEGVYRVPDKLAMPKRLGRAESTMGAADPKGIVLIDPAGGVPPKLFAAE